MGDVLLIKLAIFLIISSILEVVGVSLVLPLIAWFLNTSNSIVAISFLNNFDLKMENIVLIVISIYLVKYPKKKVARAAMEMEEGAVEGRVSE